MDSISSRGTESGSRSDRPRRNRILIGQLFKNGDCLHATILARQIKKDFPGCHLTWAISSLCRKIIDNNPDVDAVWEVPLRSWDEDDQIESWFNFENEALRLYSCGNFDFIFFTQTHIANPHLFDGTIRPSLFRAYPGKITVPLRPVLVLREDELEKVRIFAEKHLELFERVILFESSPGSAQSPMNPAMARKVAETLLTRHPGRYGIISSAQDSLRGPNCPGLIDGSVLSLRETAGLAAYCDLFIGSNSGITQAMTAMAVDELPMIQVISSGRSIYSSVVYDLHYWKLPDDSILELPDVDAPGIVRAIEDYFTLGWKETRERHHCDVKENFDYLIGFLKQTLIRRNDLSGFTLALRNISDRYGWRPEFDNLLREVSTRVLGDGTSVVNSDREEILRQLEVRALDPAAYADLQSPFRTGQFLKPYPISLRASTCPIYLRKRAREIDVALADLSSPVQVDGETLVKLRSLILDEAVEELSHRCEKNSDDRLHRGALILALVQAGQYEEAYRRLGSWLNGPGGVGDFLYHEWRGDLAWMRGEHDQAEASYQAALRERPEERRLAEKQAALFRAGNNEDGRAFRNLSQVGLVLLDLKSPFDFKSGQFDQAAKLSSQYQIEFALAGPGKESAEGAERIAIDLSGESAAAWDAKQLLASAVNWAVRKQKKWVAVAHDVENLNAFTLDQLESELNTNSTPESVFSWKINRSTQEIPFVVSKRFFFYPSLLVLPTAWAKTHLDEFPQYSLKSDRWLLAYSARLLQLIEKEDLFNDAEAKLYLQDRPATSLRWVFPPGLAWWNGMLKSETIMFQAWRFNKYAFGLRTCRKTVAQWLN